MRRHFEAAGGGLKVANSEHVNVSPPSALMERELKDKEEKMNKIKAVAIKAKKELDISKKEVESHLNSKCNIRYFLRGFLVLIIVAKLSSVNRL